MLRLRNGFEISSSLNVIEYYAVIMRTEIDTYSWKPLKSLHCNPVKKKRKKILNIKRNKDSTFAASMRAMIIYSPPT